MSKIRRRRLIALTLALFLLLALPAQALTVEQARELLTTYYVDPIPQEVLDHDTIDGILEALGDPYTDYLTPSEYAELLASMSDATLVGIGVQTLSNADTQNGLPIDAVISGGPAEAAGLLAGDLIVAVDGQDVRGMDSDDIISRIKGEEGVPVSITYLRDGVQNTVSIPRATITVAATTGQVLEGRVGYIQCTTWGEETLGHFQDLVEEMDPDVDAWLLDLRDNTGGLTQAAVDVAALFIPDRQSNGGAYPLLYFRYGDGSIDSWNSTQPCLTQKPLTVLVNGNTASASEAFCAAIRDFSRGVILGWRTYGKGVAQGLLDNTLGDPEIASWFQDGDCMKITLSRFFSPNGNTNDTIGIMPDLLLGEGYSEGDYVLDAGWLISESVSGDADALSFSQGDFAFTISLDHLNQDPAWIPAYEALLDALPPHTVLTRGGQKIAREDLADAFGLTLCDNSFPDHDGAWSAQQLDTLKTYMLLDGKQDGLFHPDDTLTRAEFCQMLYNMLYWWEPDTTSTFSDVPADAWYAPAVCAMADLGLVNGVGGGLFAPLEPIDRQQMFTILGRLLCRLNCFADLTATDMEAQVALGRADWPSDLDGYADWAKPQVWALANSLTTGDDQPINLLWNDPDAIAPTQDAIRDDAAYMMYSLLYRLDILP